MLAVIVSISPFFMITSQIREVNDYLSKKRKKAPYGAFFRGGEGGIRTLAPVTPAYSLSRGEKGG